MTQFTNYAENKLIDMIRGQGLTLPSSWFVALGSAASDSSFTELSGTGYAREAVARSLANFAGTQGAGTTLASTGSSHTSSNNVDLDWGTPGSNWGTASFLGFFDDLSAGNCWFWFPIDDIVITTGVPDPVVVPAGDLEFSLGVSGGMTDYLSNKLIDLLWRGQSYTWPSAVYVSRFTADPTNAGGGTEVAGGGYLRVTLLSATSTLSGTQSPGSTSASSGTGGRTSNNAALTWPAPTANQGTTLSLGVHDAPSAGNLLFWAPVAEPRTVNNGGPAPSVAADDLGITLD